MKKIILLFLIPICISCSEQKNTEQEMYYYSLKNFFSGEAKRLNQENPVVTKSVVHNGKIEQKKLALADWSSELALFEESDINKSSWRNSFKKDSTANRIVYQSLDDQLRTKRIEIHFKEKEVSTVKVFNSTKNFLYRSSEELSYIPDSLYRIHKKQKVFILGENEYLITSLF